MYNRVPLVIYNRVPLYKRIYTKNNLSSILIAKDSVRYNKNTVAE